MQSMLEANQKDLQQKYSALAEEKHEADALIAAFMQRLEQASAAQANLPGRDENFAEFTEVTDDNSAVESR
jgi:peptidoglycan hydrolase CwlO-like protein